MRSFPRLPLLLLLFLLVFMLLGALLARTSDNPIPGELAPSPSQRSVTELLPVNQPVIPPLPSQKTLLTTYHVFQTFNNCGPASLSMALRFYGITVSQQEMGDALRPYQVATGDNDDKSVTLAELGQKGSEYGLVPYHRPLGNVSLLKQFIAQDIPVIVRTYTKPTEDIGHFRVIKGYDDATQTMVQDDSLQGKDLHYTYEELEQLWEPFLYEYLILVPPEKVETINRILGESLEESTAWQSAVEQLEATLNRDPTDLVARFNLSVALYHVGDYQRSIQEFEQVEGKLPTRTLWYQLEPIQAYAKLGNRARVFAISDQILRNGNKAYSELYLLRGNLYQQEGNNDAAKKEYQQAVFYNRNLLEAQRALQSL